MQAELNGHAVGIILKELVRRAMTIIRNERQVFEATAKMGHSGNMDDVFTSADTNAQDLTSQRRKHPFTATRKIEAAIAMLGQEPGDRRKTLGVRCITIILAIARGVLGFPRAARRCALSRRTSRDSLVGRAFALSRIWTRIISLCQPPVRL